MGAKHEPGEIVNPDARAARDLAENGRERYGWRIVDGEPQLVVVAIGFTVAAQPFEDFASFKRRMLTFAARLGTLQHPVIALTFHRRAAQRKLPWCEFECATPESGLPDLGDGRAPRRHGGTEK